MKLKCPSILSLLPSLDLMPLHPLPIMAPMAFFHFQSFPCCPNTYAVPISSLAGPPQTNAGMPSLLPEASGSSEVPASPLEGCKGERGGGVGFSKVFGPSRVRVLMESCINLSSTPSGTNFSTKNSSIHISYSACQPASSEKQGMHYICNVSVWLVTQRCQKDPCCLKSSAAVILNIIQGPLSPGGEEEMRWAAISTVPLPDRIY